jgi:uncharacterized integral membrane protein
MARGRHDRPEEADDPGPAEGEAGLAGRRGRSPTDGPRGERAQGERERTAEGAAGDDAVGADQRSVPTSVRVAQTAVLLLAVLFGVFALVNSQPVDFSWVFGETQVERTAGGEVTSGGIPLIVLLLVSFIFGAVLGGWWVGAATKARQRRDAAAP